MLSDNFTGYILAGGKSSRMGRDKAFLEIGDKTFVENAIDALKPNCSQVKIVLNKSQIHFIEKLPSNIPYIFDRFENRGALGGIHAALEDCQTDFAIILAVDLPFVKNGFIEKLCAIAIEPNRFSAIIPEQTDKRLQPLCGIYRKKACLPVIKNLMRKPENSLSVHFFLSKLTVKTVSQKQLAADPNLLLNVNTFDEYKKIKSGS